MACVVQTRDRNKPKTWLPRETELTVIGSEWHEKVQGIWRALSWKPYLVSGGGEDQEGFLEEEAPELIPKALQVSTQAGHNKNPTQKAGVSRPCK